MYICDNTDLLEIKMVAGCSTQSKLIYLKLLPNRLHFIATAKAIKALKNGTMPKKVSSNGLLVNKKAAMTFFTLKADIEDLSHELIQCSKL